MLVVLLLHIELPWRDYLSAVFPAIAGSFAMCLAVIGLNRLLQSESLPAVLRLALLVAAGAAVYGAVVLGFFRSRLQRYATFLSSLRKSKATPLTAVL
jgi:hypothetical protein